MKITAAIITFNEERNISRCLTSLKGIVEEIVVVDSFSSDSTEKICKSFGATFVKNKFEGHIQQKNFALSLAKSPWIISLDADEALDEELRRNILKLTEDDEVHGYEMNRLTNYCGHWVKHCGWYPDTKLRLVKNGSAKWTGINPHDKLELINSKKSTHILGDILHYSYYTKEDHLKQIEFFSSIAAKELFARNKKSSWPLIVLKVVAQFIKSFFIRTGFMDGKTGFEISRLSAYATYRKYHKLKLLHEGKSI